MLLSPGPGRPRRRAGSPGADRHSVITPRQHAPAARGRPRRHAGPAHRPGLDAATRSRPATHSSSCPPAPPASNCAAPWRIGCWTRGQPSRWPRVGPRADLYRELVVARARPLDMLSPFDREVLLARLAREVTASGLEPPFALRPGARRRDAGALRPHPAPGAHPGRLRAQPACRARAGRRDRSRRGPTAAPDTVSLARCSTAYERHLRPSGPVRRARGACRAWSTDPSARPLRHVVVTVGDRIADPDGLWPVDFTLLSTLPLLERLDVVATEALLASGLLERIHAALPELEEVPAERGHDRLAPGGGRPTLVVPGTDGPAVFESRDREDELARWRGASRPRAARATPRRCHRHALIVRRPLPYLYLARSVFGGAGLPFETLDTLPLAAEPYAAALDLVLDVVGSGFTRVATVALLRSPHFRFADGAEPLPAVSVSALDRALAESRYLGGLDRLARLSGEWVRPHRPRHTRRASSSHRRARGARSPRAGAGVVAAGRARPGARAAGDAADVPRAPPSRAGRGHRHRAARARASCRHRRPDRARPRLRAARPGRGRQRRRAGVHDSTLAGRADLCRAHRRRGRPRARRAGRALRRRGRCAAGGPGGRRMAGAVAPQHLLPAVPARPPGPRRLRPTTRTSARATRWRRPARCSWTCSDWPRAACAPPPSPSNPTPSSSPRRSWTTWRRWASSDRSSLPCATSPCRPTRRCSPTRRSSTRCRPRRGRGPHLRAARPAANDPPLLRRGWPVDVAHASASVASIVT